MSSIENSVLTSLGTYYNLSYIWVREGKEVLIGEHKDQKGRILAVFQLLHFCENA